ASAPAAATGDGPALRSAFGGRTVAGTSGGSMATATGLPGPGAPDAAAGAGSAAGLPGANAGGIGDGAASTNAGPGATGGAVAGTGVVTSARARGAGMTGV